MPSDTGSTTEGGIPPESVVSPARLPPTDDHLAALRPIKIALDPGGHVGQALQAARISLGLVPEDLALVTRVRASYIAALEAFDFDALPARPFVVGYLRAYAQALGLDAEVVVARFHGEAPKADGKLRPPGGVRQDTFSSIRWLITVGAVLAAAVFVWNLTRRAELRSAPPVQSVIGPAVSARPTAGPAQIGAPLATPPEATTPPVYQTPGLAPAGSAQSPVTGPSAADPGVGAAFVRGGEVYGAGGSAGGLLLQARKSTSLVVRGPSGVIYFARLLSPGEAWRAPNPANLTADVADPLAMEVFVGGLSRGRLTQAQTSLAQLGQP